MWQANIYGTDCAHYIRNEVISSDDHAGDQILDVTLSKIGGKGPVVKDWRPVKTGRADLAVHSLKDVPMNMPEGFVLAAIGEREDPLDAFVRMITRTLPLGRRQRGRNF